MAESANGILVFSGAARKAGRAKDLEVASEMENRIERRRTIGSQGERRPRRFSRHRFDARIQVSVFSGRPDHRMLGRTSELGRTAFGATLSGELKTGEVVSLEFPIPLPPQRQ